MTYKRFDKEAFYERLLLFGQSCQKFTVKLPKNAYNIEYGSQLIRSSASPGANYIEALEAESRKDFIHKLKICRKETRESIHWLRLIKEANTEIGDLTQEAEKLIEEGKQIVRFLTSSIITLENKKTR